MQSSLCYSILLAGAVCAAEVKYMPLDPPVRMPDGSQFLTWSDATRYARTYHVDQSHPRASDENPGTERLPFKTVNRAAQVVKAGERVWIHSGVYREMVEPRFSGEGSERMIAYEAAPGERVVLKGSCVLESRWERSARAIGGGRLSQYSRKLWMTTLPDSAIAQQQNPFATPNATDEEMDLMPWALSWKGRLPYTLKRGLLFQGGRRMTQLAAYEDLIRLPGSYWVAEDGRTVHIHAFGGGDPNKAVFEAAVQPHIFKPREAGLGFIRVSRLVIEHCANSFLRTGIGALFTRGGHHWLIEGNTVRHANSVGIEIGFDVFEKKDKRWTRRQDPDLGHTIVRNNIIQDCGTAGVRGHTNSHALVEQNEITDCGWQDAEYHWETGGIKLLINTGTLVRNNHIARIEGGGGVWLDWNNKNSRVTGNVIRDISSVQGAVFVEASQSPNMVDNNVFWNIDGQGVRAADTDFLVVAHNLFGRVKDDLVMARVATNRALGGRKLTATNNRVVNNVFVEAERPLNLGDPSNRAENNVYMKRPGQAGLKPLDAENGSVLMEGTAVFDYKTLTLSWRRGGALPCAPMIGGVSRDFHGRERQADLNTAGPFSGLRGPAEFLLQPGSSIARFR